MQIGPVADDIVIITGNLDIVRLYVPSTTLEGF